MSRNLVKPCENFSLASYVNNDVVLISKLVNLTSKISLTKSAIVR